MGGVRRGCGGYGESKDREIDLKVSRGEIRGRSRGYERGGKYGELKDREIDFKVSRGEIRGRRGYERAEMRGKGELKDWEMNFEDIGVLSSGGVGLWRCRSGGRGVDREPGELSSESGSDDSLVNENDIKGVDQGKKRKEGCDRSLEDGVSHQPLSSKVGLDDVDCVSSRPSKIAKFEVPEPREVSVELDPRISTCSSSLVDLTCSGEGHRGGVEDENFPPSRNIRSSRWADDFDSPSGEGAIYEDEEMPKLKNNVTDSVRIRGCKNSLTPELRKLKRDELVGVRSMCESVERVFSSSRDSCSGHVTENNDMEEDEDHHYDGGSASQSDTELEDAHSTPKPDFSQRRNVNMLHGCRSVEEFERLNKINEGTYGIVYRARDKKTGEIVALKKVKMEKEREGFPMTALREINILLSFDHSSIVDVKEIVVGSSLDDIFLVMEYMEHDLKAFLKSREQPFSESEVKGLMLQLLKGTKYLHGNWVLHRDLKTSNLLLNNNLELKICDFGLARQYGSPLKPYTQLVVTLSYRAPELLLGAKQYSTAIDMWSLGCIMAELLSKQTLFNGKSEIDQIDKIFRTLGTPNDKVWPGYSKLPGAKGTFVKNKNNMLRKKFPPSSFTGAPVLSDAGFDLLSKLLTYDPETRISAEAALEHRWFQEVPPSKDKELLPTFLFWHGPDRHMQGITKGTDPLKDLQSNELQQWGSKTGGVFG